MESYREEKEREGTFSELFDVTDSGASPLPGTKDSKVDPGSGVLDLREMARAYKAERERSGADARDGGIAAPSIPGSNQWLLAPTTANSAPRRSLSTPALVGLIVGLVSLTAAATVLAMVSIGFREPAAPALATARNVSAATATRATVASGEAAPRAVADRVNSPLPALAPANSEKPTAAPVAAQPVRETAVAPTTVPSPKSPAPPAAPHNSADAESATVAVGPTAAPQRRAKRDDSDAGRAAAAPIDSAKPVDTSAATATATATTESQASPLEPSATQEDNSEGDNSGDETVASASTASQPPVPQASPQCDEVMCLVDPSAACCQSKRADAAETAATKKEDLPAHLTPTELNAGLRPVRGRIMSCGDRHGFSGTARLKLVILPSGKVDRASVAEGTSDFQQCMADIARKASFARTVEGLTVAYPLVFR